MAKITDQFIRALRVPEGKAEVQEFDNELHGFGVHANLQAARRRFSSVQRRHAAAPQDAGAVGA